MFDKNAKTSTLEVAFNFSPDDLRQNRSGRLSPPQAAALRKNSRRLAFIVLGVIGGLALLTLISTPVTANDLSILFLCLVIPAGVTFATTIGATEAALVPGVVSQRSGIAHLAYGISEYDPPFELGQRIPRRFVMGRMGAYSLVLGDSEFILTRDQWQAIRPGASITIYFLPTLHKIVALEVHDTDIELPETPPITMLDITAEPVRIPDDEPDENILA